ncbi:hypothetical protein QR680_011909 [Steinernema hermaphroditum]|uniref:G-protein coupled receptors family 1 profile domain-containing protein n=1 Tax=Steinernema hermaphroditum TaxID=289476 RepID=A0AA39LZK1_9BILA|nr:hypothetical protein QR680_011909 [Steinernema hermaphroditum]
MMEGSRPSFGGGSSPPFGGPSMLAGQDRPPMMHGPPPMIYVLLPTLALAPFGLFGNINVIIATYRKKNLRSKCGILICLLAIYDTICITFEVSSAFMGFYNVWVDRQTCFKVIIIYFWMRIISSSALVGLALDRLVSVTFPLRYKSDNFLMMLLVSVLPGLFLSIIFTIFGIIHWDEENYTTPVCVPNHILPSWIQEVADFTLLVINSSVIVIYLAGYMVLSVQKRRFVKDSHLHAILKSHQKAMKSMTVFLAVFCVSWFYSQVPVGMMVSYSECYYVYFWTSVDYRAAFLEQLPCVKKWWKGKMVKTRVVTVAPHTTTKL